MTLEGGWSPVPTAFVFRTSAVRIPCSSGGYLQFSPIYGEEGAVLLQDGSLIKTVLVVEDEIELLALIAQILRRSGYLVLEASTPSEALFICENNEIDLMLSDFNLPEANGIILAQKVERVRPNLPMIFMSGNRQAYDELTARLHLLEKAFFICRHGIYRPRNPRCAEIRLALPTRAVPQEL